MALPKDYAGDGCSMSRALEVVGERWTLLVVRDAFFGVRRFGDFIAHLGIPRAVLTDRLASLVREGVLTVVPGGHGHDEYALTGKGVSLWPVVRGLLAWGDDHYSEAGPRRLFHHAADDGEVGEDGVCARCGGVVAPGDLVMTPGPGLGQPGHAGQQAKPMQDVVRVALAAPLRLLEPIRG